MRSSLILFDNGFKMTHFHHFMSFKARDTVVWYFVRGCYQKILLRIDCRNATSLHGNIFLAYVFTFYNGASFCQSQSDDGLFSVQQRAQAFIQSQVLAQIQLYVLDLEVLLENVGRLSHNSRIFCRVLLIYNCHNCKSSFGNLMLLSLLSTHL